MGGCHQTCKDGHTLNLNRYRQGLASALLVLAGLLISTSAIAQKFPNRPVRIVVPFAAGGGTDILARLLAQRLGDQWGQNVMVDNRPGAGTVIGSDAVARSPADGYTLLFTANPHTSNPALIAKLPYDTTRDFAAVSMLVSAPMILVVNSSVPAQSVQQLIALARSRPDSLSYASSGNGGPQHLAGEYFKFMADVNMVHVPYKGTAPALVDLIGNQVQVSFTSLLASMPHLKNGTLRALGVTGLKRVEGFADVPTLSEAGLNGFEYLTWYGVFAPAATPQALLTSLHQDMARALDHPDINGRLAREGLQAVANRPEEFDAFVRSEIETVRKLVAKAGIKAN